ncbi:hypothetical protein LCGC14_0234960 [marine sediment metagenome]|uniref:Uncharacterized protein n=1 Tax=marine sediment metagenome TaxID=412755 RepID=A0A0F9U8U7_9ZZZZ
MKVTMNTDDAELLVGAMMDLMQEVARVEDVGPVEYSGPDQLTELSDKLVNLLTGKEEQDAEHNGLSLL